MEEANGRKSKCLVCKELIQADAQVCIHCSSPQNWRRHLGLGLSSTIIALLVALIGVSASAITSLYPIIRGNYSSVKLDFLSSDFYSVTLVASNTGNRLGAIGSARVTFKFIGDEVDIPVRPEIDDTLVSPGELKEIEIPLEKIFGSYADTVNKYSHNKPNKVPSTSDTYIVFGPNGKIFTPERDLDVVLYVGTIQFGGEKTPFSLTLPVACNQAECIVSPFGATKDE